MNNLVRLLGFVTLRCGCVIGKYRAANREVSYVEHKGDACSHGGSQGHRNSSIAPNRFRTISPIGAGAAAVAR